MINIELRKSESFSNDISAFVKFEYDFKIVNAIKYSLKVRRYIASEKCWEVALEELEELIATLREFDEVNLNMKKEIYTPEEIKEIDYKFKTKPFQHQLEGFEYGKANPKFILGDDMGLGKTKSVIDLACYFKKLHGYKHALIICGVSGLQYNWESEVYTHCNEKPYIVGTRYKKRGGKYIGTMADRLYDLQNLDKIDAYFIITNVNTMGDCKDISKEGSKRKKLEFPQVDEILKYTKSKSVGLIAFDEIHKCKNVTSNRGKALLKLNADKLIAMSGTPLMNSPLDLYVPLKWTNNLDVSYYVFKNNYCEFGGYNDAEIIGYQHLDNLQKILDKVQLRRLKSDVLDLPEKVHTTEYVSMGTKQQKIYKEVMTQLQEDIDKIRLSLNPLTSMIRARQSTGATSILSTTVDESAKLDRADELLEEIVATGGKAIIYSNWTSITDVAEKRLAKYNPAIVTGETRDKESAIKRFMTDDTCHIVIGTIGALGTGFTLTKANTVIFLDEPWNRANKEQAEDRAHRIGTKETVNIITMICPNTLDEYIHKLVHVKGKMADMLVDKKISEKELFEELMKLGM